MSKEDVLGLPIALPDGIDYGDYIIGSYIVTAPSIIPLPKLAPIPAVEHHERHLSGAIRKGSQRAGVIHKAMG